VRLEPSFDSAAVYIAFVSFTKMRAQGQACMLPHFAHVVMLLLERATRMAERGDMEYKHMCGVCGCIAKLWPKLAHSVVREAMESFVQLTCESLPRRLCADDEDDDNNDNNECGAPREPVLVLLTRVSGQDLGYLCEALSQLGLHSDRFQHLVSTVLAKDWRMLWSAHSLTLTSAYLQSANPHVWKCLSYRLQEIAPDLPAKGLRTALTSFVHARAMDGKLFTILCSHLAERAYELSAPDLVHVASVFPRVSERIMLSSSSSSSPCSPVQPLHAALLRLIPRRASSLTTTQAVDLTRALRQWPPELAHAVDPVRMRRAVFAVQAKLSLTAAAHSLLLAENNNNYNAGKKITAASSRARKQIPACPTTDTARTDSSMHKKSSLPDDRSASSVELTGTLKSGDRTMKNGVPASFSSSSSSFFSDACGKTGSSRPEAKCLIPLPRTETWLEECAIRRIRPNQEEIRAFFHNRCAASLSSTTLQARRDIMTTRLARALFLLDYAHVVHEYYASCITRDVDRTNHDGDDDHHSKNDDGDVDTLDDDDVNTGELSLTSGGHHKKEDVILPIIWASFDDGFGTHTSEKYQAPAQQKVLLLTSDLLALQTVHVLAPHRCGLSQMSLRHLREINEKMDAQGRAEGEGGKEEHRSKSESEDEVGLRRQGRCSDVVVDNARRPPLNRWLKEINRSLPSKNLKRGKCNTGFWYQPRLKGMPWPLFSNSHTHIIPFFPQNGGGPIFKGTFTTT